MRYRLSELAEQDLLEIWLYVAADASAERADLLVEAIGERFKLLQSTPVWDGDVPNSAPTYTSFVVEKHVIYYRPEKELLIARVLHGSRDQAAAWQESAEGDQRKR